MDGDAPANHGEDRPVFPGADFSSDEDEEKLSAAE
jgi:hypothetical protein